MGAETQDPALDLRTGARIGRFIVLAMVGRGGMGEVYAAFDPELDRKVAVKLLRKENAVGVDPSEGRTRMVREAKAIAKLSDPNVVTVYDVGTFEGRVFLAMEFVDGHTLTYWQHAQPRGWRETLGLYRAAGRGLDSAHRAGIVHRDFKPDNVMVGRDGAVRVMDFGLARELVEPGQALGVMVDGERATPPSASLTPSMRLAARSSSVHATVSRVVITLSNTSKAELKTPGSGVGAGVDSNLSVPAAKGSGAWPPAVAGEEGGEPAPATEKNVGPPLGASGTDASENEQPLEGATRDLGKPFSVELPPGSSLPLPMSSQLTQTGAMMGTPAYMAPEQFQGRAVDARSDQFSFCVALYEALYGTRPFAGKSLDEITRAVISGTVRDAPPHSKVPSWVRRVVLRGLRVDRTQRFPSMGGLLEALGRDPARSRRKWTLVAVGSTVVAGLLGGLVRAERLQRQRCTGAPSRLVGVWELPAPDGALSPRKRAIQAAFLATGKRYAADSFTVVMNVLDRYVTGWNDMHREACQAANIRGEQSSDVLDLRMTCLQGRLSEVQALTSIFTHADGEVVTRSVQAAESLHPLEPCADVAVLKALVRPPDDPAVKSEVARIRRELADVTALRSAGKYKDALPKALDALGKAQATGYKPLIAETHLRLGEVQQWAGMETGPIEANLEKAVWLAEASRHDEVALEASTDLLYEVGIHARFAEGERWGRFAEALLDRMGPGHDVLRAWRLNNLSLVRARQGRLDEALEDSKAATALKIQTLGPADFDVALSEMNTGLFLNEIGQTDAALRINREALEILAKTVGTDHPQYAKALANSADFSNHEGSLAESRALAVRALGILEHGRSEDYLALTDILTTMGENWLAEKRPVAAIAPLERALSIAETHPEVQPWMMRAEFALAKALWTTGQDQSRGMRLARAASSLAQAEPMSGKFKAEIDAWLGEHHLPGRSVSMR